MNDVKQVLTINEEIKNYKKMCEILDEKISTGKSKILQIEEWSRFMSWNKVGNSFIITEIYDEPIPKAESKVSLGNNNIYAKYIEILLMNLLSQQDNYTIICSRNWLMASLGIVNFKYISKQQRELVRKTGEFEEDELNEWFSRAWQKTDQILFSALNNLERRCLLDYKKEYSITVIDDSSITGESSYIASDFERQQYLTAKRDALNIMTEKRKKSKIQKKFDSMKDLYPNYYNEFYETLDDVISDYGWLAVHTQYKLIYNKQHLIQAIPSTEIQLHKLELNNKVIDAMHNDASTKVKNSLQKFQDEYALLCETWLGNPSEKDCKSYKFLKPENYVEVQDKISDVFIKIKN